MLRILIVTFALAVTKTLGSIDFSYGNAPLYPLQPKLISQSVQLKDIPTKVIKITKTVAVKVPVPYPVKIPHHIPVPVPVKQLYAVPVPHIVKVPHHVPVEVDRPIPVNLPQQVPIFVPKTVEVPHPVPVHVSKSIYYHQPLHYETGHADEHTHDTNEDLYAGAASYGANQGYGGLDDRIGNEHYSAGQNHDSYFRPSQPDYTHQQQNTY